jgi:NADH:ubiquinone oxidoreductase subunit 6 (subunit J)
MTDAFPLAAPLAFLPDLTEHVPTILFTVLALICVVSALAAATAPRIVHAAFGLMATFFGVAGIYAMLGADFVALSQVIVYVGGILVLLVFGILLTGRTQETLGLESATRRGGAIAIGGLVFLGLMLAIGGTDWNAVETPGDPQPTTAAIGRAFLDPDQFLVPFEVASVLLLAALVGAAYLARRRRQP